MSVVIPTYNRAHVVGRSIQSVLGQTYPDFEIIVVNDGSTDNTEEIVKSFTDGRVRYIRHEKNQGAASARNTGIKATRGKLIAFQDSDDEWWPEKLDRQVQACENAPATVGVVYTDMWRIRGAEKKYWHSPENRPQDGIVHKQGLDRLLGIGIQTAVIKKECFDKVGVFDESFPRLMDLELLIRISKYYSFYHIREPLVDYYLSGNSITSDHRALVTAYEKISEKYSYAIVKDRLSQAKHLHWIGNILVKSHDLDQGRAYLFEAAKSYPFNIRYVVSAFVSLFGERAYMKVGGFTRRMLPMDRDYEGE